MQSLVRSVRALYRQYAHSTTNQQKAKHVEAYAWKLTEEKGGESRLATKQTDACDPEVAGEHVHPRLLAEAAHRETATAVVRCTRHSSARQPTPKL